MNILKAPKGVIFILKYPLFLGGILRFGSLKVASNS